ncbi:hypothetical protein ABPG74_015499 [Tetrahymena malaccensis]
MIKSFMDKKFSYDTNEEKSQKKDKKYQPLIKVKNIYDLNEQLQTKTSQLYYLKVGIIEIDWYSMLTYQYEYLQYYTKMKKQANLQALEIQNNIKYKYSFTQNDLLYLINDFRALRIIREISDIIFCHFKEATCDLNHIKFNYFILLCEYSIQKFYDQATKKFRIVRPFRERLSLENYTNTLNCYKQNGLTQSQPQNRVKKERQQRERLSYKNNSNNLNFYKQNEFTQSQNSERQESERILDYYSDILNYYKQYEITQSQKLTSETKQFNYFYQTQNTEIKERKYLEKLSLENSSNTLNINKQNEVTQSQTQNTKTEERMYVERLSLENYTNSLNCNKQNDVTDGKTQICQAINILFIIIIFYPIMIVIESLFFSEDYVEL